MPAGPDPSTARPYHRVRAARTAPDGDGGKRDQSAGHRRSAGDRRRIELPSWAFGNSGHAVQGVRPGGRPARPVREDRRRRAGPPLHRRRPDRRAAHPVGQGRRLRRPRPPRRATAASPSARSTRTRSRTTTTCSAASAIRTRGSGARPSTTCSSASTSWTRPGRATSSCGSPTGRTTRARTTSAARQDRLAESLADRLRPARAGPADGARVQALRAVVLHDGRARLGHGAASTASRSGPRPRSSSTPATTRRARTSSSSSRRCCAPDKLGAFDFNSRFYADDDLMVGAADPFQLFRIMHEVVKAGALEPEVGVAFMLDQCHNIEPKIPGQIRSVMNVQEATAKALLVDQAALDAAQAAGDVLGANARPDGRLRHRRPAAARRRPRGPGLDPDPMAAYARSGYAAADRRGTGRRPAGGLGRMTPGPTGRRDAGAHGRRAARPLPPARRGPAQHELRRRQHLGQGHRRSTRSRARPSSCCGSRARAATSGR